jgi:hypothetical protein
MGQNCCIAASGIGVLTDFGKEFPAVAVHPLADEMFSSQGSPPVLKPRHLAAAGMMCRSNLACK